MLRPPGAGGGGASAGGARILEVEDVIPTAKREAEPSDEARQWIGLCGGVEAIMSRSSHWF
jgi:hypothetical protein